MLRKGITYLKINLITHFIRIERNDFQDHFYNFSSKVEELGADNIIREGQKGRGKVDFIIKGPIGSTLTPVELKFVNENTGSDFNTYIKNIQSEVKQYIVDNNRNIGFLLIIDITPQERVKEADKASYYQPLIVMGGKSVSPKEDPNPIGIIAIYLLGGKRTVVSKIKD